jgi:hypothetical protein
MGEIEDDTILDVVDIMSKAYLNIDEEEIEEDIILDVVDFPHFGLVGFFTLFQLFQPRARIARHHRGTLRAFPFFEYNIIGIKEWIHSSIPMILYIYYIILYIILYNYILDYILYMCGRED